MKIACVKMKDRLMEDHLCEDGTFCLIIDCEDGRSLMITFLLIFPDVTYCAMI